MKYIKKVNNLPFAIHAYDISQTKQLTLVDCSFLKYNFEKWLEERRFGLMPNWYIPRLALTDLICHKWPMSIDSRMIYVIIRAVSRASAILKIYILNHIHTEELRTMKEIRNDNQHNVNCFSSWSDSVLFFTFYAVLFGGRGLWAYNGMLTSKQTWQCHWFETKYFTFTWGVCDELFCALWLVCCMRYMHGKSTVDWTMHYSALVIWMKLLLRYLPTTKLVKSWRICIYTVRLYINWF